MPKPLPHAPSVDAARAWMRIVFALGCICALMAVAVLVGWHAHIFQLIQLRHDFAPMQYNTAVCFILIGAALCAYVTGAERAWMGIAGGVVTAAAGLTICEYLFHADLGIDQLLFHPYITTATPHAGRMSPATSFCFTLAGISCLFLCIRETRPWRNAVVGANATVIISITLVAVMGYAFNLPVTSGWGDMSGIALHAAAGLTLAGVALLTIAWNGSRHDGERTPRWLPVALVLSLATGALVLSIALDEKQNEEIEQTIRAGAESVGNQVALRMDGRLRSLVRMAQRWEFVGGTSKEAWQADATNYVHDFPDLQALEWMDATHHVRWIVPLAGNEAKLNLDLTVEQRRKEAVTEAEKTHKPVITRTVTLFRGGLGFVVYVPIRIKGEAAGFIVAVLKADQCLDRYLPRTVAAGEALQFLDGDQVFYERDTTAPPMRKNWVQEDQVQLPGTTWKFRIWPTPTMAARLYAPLPQVTLGAGMLGALLLGAACYFAQRASRHAAEAVKANASLQDALDKVQTLEGLLPICSCCKRVRDDTGYWNQIDSYIHKHTNASLSHSYCPECAAKTFLEFGFEVPEKVQAELDAGRFEAVHSGEVL